MDETVNQELLTECEVQNLDEVRAGISALSIATADSVLNVLPVVKRTARELKHPRRSEFTFERGDKTGPVISMSVIGGAIDRACLLADTLLRSCEALGWRFMQARQKEPESRRQGYSGGAAHESPGSTSEPHIGQLLIEGERVGLHIEERLRDEKRDPTAAELAREKREYGYRASRKIRVPTGKLRIVRLDTYRTYGDWARLTWYDRGNTPVEQQLPDILVSFFELALSIKTRRAEDERQERERKEAEQRLQQLEARRGAHAKLIAQLESDAGAWHRARYLRRYVRAARRAVATSSQGACIRVSFMKQMIDFLDWAEEYVNQLDPLQPAVRRPEFESEKSSYYRNDDEQLKASLARLLGAHWETSWKLGADYSPPPEQTPGERVFSYREKSVFEIPAGNDSDEEFD